MKPPIYANKKHEIIIKEYLAMHKDLIREVANNNRYDNYMEKFSLIVDYHNTYGEKNRDIGNWYDWLMIIPINISVLSLGFLAAIETKRNRALVRSYRILVNDLVHDVADKLENIERVDE